MNQDASQIKEKIISIVKRRGPSLPVHIASETGLSILFASAFLSELIGDRKIKTSFMKVGSSPIYLLPEQQHQLEKYSHHLKSKEKDAYLLLKDKKFLKDSKQDPAIRVALRAIKDFAIPFKQNEEIFFRYFTISQDQFNKKPTPKPQPSPKPIEKTPQNIEPITEPKPAPIQTSQPIEKISPIEKSVSSPKQVETEPISKDLEIFDKSKPVKKTVKKKSIIKRKPSQKKDEKFFNLVKEFLQHKEIEIIDIESFNKNDLILKVKLNEKEKLLIAYNKKRIDEKDILNANKKSIELNLPYIILSLGSPLKKLSTLIDAVKRLDWIEKL